MNWTFLGPAVLTLVGVALGTVASLFGVYQAQRTAREETRLQHEAALRVELREVILGYLRAVENSWAFLDGLWGRQPLTSVSGEPLHGDAVDREAALRNHEVWYHQQELTVMGGEALRLTSLELTRRIYVATFHRDRLEDTFWRFLDPAQEAFLSAARDELGTLVSVRSS